MPKQLVVYFTAWCPSCQDAQAALSEWGVEGRRVNIARDRDAAERVRMLTGFESVPTLVVVDGDGVDPIEAPLPLPPGKGPSGIDRGTVLTEPTRTQMRTWLIKHGFLA